MPGYTKDENNLAAGIPDRNIGPETGSYGNATKTNTGDTSEGTNQDHESMPPPAAGLTDGAVAPEGIGERRSFSSGATGTAGLAQADEGVEPVYQQIANGGDRFDPDKRLDDADDEDSRTQRGLSDEERQKLDL